MKKKELIGRMLSAGVDVNSICGVCSGIPECCTKYYTQVWLPFVINGGDSHLITDALDLMGYNYIPCTECRRNNNKKTVKKCRDNICELLKIDEKLRSLCDVLDKN